MNMNRILFVIAVTLMLLFLSGCAEDYPRIKIMNTPWSSVISLDLGNCSTFNHFERFDDENETKIVLYFDKKEK